MLHQDVACIVFERNLSTIQPVMATACNSELQVKSYAGVRSPYHICIPDPVGTATRTVAATRHALSQGRGWVPYAELFLTPVGHYHTARNNGLCQLNDAGAAFTMFRVVHCREITIDHVVGRKFF